jgi:hypothetical protein
LPDAGNPDAPSSVAQACVDFGGAPYDYSSVDDLLAKLSKRWVGCGDNPVPPAGGIWPSGFVGVRFDPGGTWQALVRMPDGSVQPAVGAPSSGTFHVARYPGDAAADAPIFVLYFFVGNAAVQSNDDADDQWEGNLEESPEILHMVASHTGQDFRFSSAAP